MWCIGKEAELARKKGRSKAKSAASDPWDGRALYRWFQTLAGSPWRLWLRRGLTALVLAIVVVGSGLGLDRLDEHVRAMPAYSTGLSFRLVNPPAWFADLPLEQEILGGLESYRNRSLLDDRLVEEVAGDLRQNPWVQQVVRVEKRHGGEVSILCVYRRPIAAIQRHEQVAWIDAASVRVPVLPGENKTLIWVDGIETPAPAVGDLWAGDDIVAAVRLASMLIDEPYADQIASMSFANYGGRGSRLSPHIKLVTGNGNEILWGFAPGEEIEEPDAGQKIALLRRIYRQFKQVDTNRAWVNLTKGKDRIGRARSTGMGSTARGE